MFVVEKLKTNGIIFLGRVIGIFGIALFRIIGPLPFDSEGWKAARERGDVKTCYRMWRTDKEEIRRHLHSYESAVNILGFPDRASNSNNLMRFNMGRHRSGLFPIANQIWLDLMLQEDWSYSASLSAD